jgi:type II secretory pathway component PulF
MAIAAINRKMKKTGEDKSFSEKIKNLNLEINVSRGISTRELIFFTSQLSLMIEIGTALNVGLDSIAKQIKNPMFKQVITDIIADVEGGSLLSDAMGKYPRIFSNVYVSLVKAGENSGELKQMLDRAVTVQEKQEKFLATTVTVVIFLLTFVFPRFAVLFEEIEDILPASTKFLLYLSTTIRSSWLSAVILAGIIVGGIYIFAKSRTGRLLIDRLKMSIPVLADACIRIYLVQMMRTLGFLMLCNVPLMDALRITRAGINNLIFTRFIDETTNHLKEGRGMSLAFIESSFIPESAKQIVKTGEETQNIAKVMLRLSDYYEGEIDDQMKKFATIIEPALLIVMGVVVGTIVMSLILPIFKLSKMVH